MRYITGTKLRDDIYDYRRTKIGVYNEEKHYKSTDILERADKILMQYSDNSIGVRDKDNKIMAQYINTFAVGNRDALLTKLQNNADFDVYQYLADNEKTRWQRLFHRDSKQPRFISAKSLQRKIKKYHKLNQKLSHGWFHNDREYSQQNILESEAKRYAADFLADKILVTRQDVSVLKDYFTAFYRQRDVTDIANALNKIADTPSEAYTEKAPSRFKMFLTTAKSGLKNLVNRIKPQSHKASIVPMSRKSWLKVASVSAIFALAGAAFLKSDSIAKETKQDNKEIKKQTPVDKPINTLTDVNFADAAKELTKEQKVWKNFYNTKSELHAANAGINLQDLYAKIEAQQASGIFTLPENISVERFAFTHLMYKAYGLSSPLEDALNGQHKLSPQQQQAIEEAVNIAGEKGLGIKQIAKKQSRKMGRQLGNRSAYDSASKDMKQKYITAVREAKMLNKRSM